MHFPFWFWCDYSEASPNFEYALKFCVIWYWHQTKSEKAEANEIEDNWNCKIKGVMRFDWKKIDEGTGTMFIIQKHT